MAIPPHTSHILQLLDSTPFVQFKHNWQAKLLEWNFTKGAKVLANRFFLEVFWPAWRESMTMGNIQSGFCKTGIFPGTRVPYRKQSLHQHKSQTVRKFCLTVMGYKISCVD